MDCEILVAPDGTVRMIYSDDVAPMLRELGRVRIARASHVEPDGEGRWWADMSPVGGPRLLGPFRLRADALAAEALWLERNLIPAPRET